MKTQLFVLSILACLPAVGCTDSNNTGEFVYSAFDLANSGDGGVIDVTPPAIPFIGPQIDRVGRPGINLLLTDPFDIQSKANPPKTITNIQDAYNSAVSEVPNQAVWLAQASLIETSLGIWDGIDGINGCGNQALAGATPVAGRYGALAKLLAADYLVVDTSKKSCQSFMAVELPTATNATECGGRLPNPGGAGAVIDNLMDILQGPPPPAVPLKKLTTGVNAEGDVPTLPASNTRFPFLNPPT
jgi:hypothetical protein